MLKAAIKDLLRPLMRWYRRFTGIDRIEAKLDRLISGSTLLNREQGDFIVSDDMQTAGHADAPWQTLYMLSEKLDLLLRHRQSADRTDVHISREIDRLDGYLQYHANEIRAGLQLLLDRKEKTGAQ